MPNGALRVLTLGAIALLGTTNVVASAGAATAIGSCATLDVFGATYVLTSDLASCGTCLVVAKDRITIDLAGHRISGTCGGAGVTDDGAPRHRTTVKNGAITGFEIGVFLAVSERNLIRNIEASANSRNGIIAGARSLVKGCVIEDNGENGIIIGEFGQIQGSTIARHIAPTGNGGSGIIGAGHVLITDNVVEDNLVGIVIGDFGTVSFNTSRRNAFSGLFVGNHSLVTGNATSENGNTGISAGGFSTITYNTSSGNGAGGIDVGVDGLFDGTHSLITGNTTNDNSGVGLEAWCPSTVTNNRSSGNGSDYNFNGAGCRTKNNN